MQKTWGVWAVRSDTGVAGWCKQFKKPLLFDSKAEAEGYAEELRQKATAIKVTYDPKEMA